MSHADPLTVYQSLIDATPDLEMKGAKSKYTSMNGNMFSFITTENQLAVRLSADDRTAFLAKHPSSVCHQYGALMKDYVLVPSEMLSNKRQVSALFKKCVENAKTLKAKPTNPRKKK